MLFHPCHWYLHTNSYVELGYVRLWVFSCFFALMAARLLSKRTLGRRTIARFASTKASSTLLLTSRVLSKQCRFWFLSQLWKRCTVRSARQQFCDARHFSCDVAFWVLLPRPGNVIRGIAICVTVCTQIFEALRQLYINAISVLPSGKEELDAGLNNR